MKSLLARFKRKEDEAPRSERTSVAVSTSLPAAEGPKAEELDIQELSLELGDFLPRIPSKWLKPDQHDLLTPVRFDLGEIADRIARTETTIPLALLYQRVPQIFKGEIPISEKAEIHFPWQKVLKLIDKTAPGASQAASLRVEALAQKLKERQSPNNSSSVSPAVPNNTVAPNPKESLGNRQLSWFSRSAPAPTGAVQTPRQKPVTLSPPAATDLESVTSASAPAARNAALPPPLLAPKPQAMPVILIGDDSQLSREDLIRARDLAIGQLAKVRGEYERQIAALVQEGKQLTEQRDRALAEVKSVRQQMEDRLDQLEFEKSLIAKTSEKIARQELRKAQQELEGLRSQLSATVLSGTIHANG